jgi:hypothetical protein
MNTNHATQRADDRLNWNEETLKRLESKIWRLGITYQEATGRLKKYFIYLYESHGKVANEIRIYGRNVYIYKDGLLITVLDLPRPYWNAARKIQKREREAEK